MKEHWINRRYFNVSFLIFVAVVVSFVRRVNGKIFNSDFISFSLAFGTLDPMDSRAHIHDFSHIKHFGSRIDTDTEIHTHTRTHSHAEL